MISLLLIDELEAEVAALAELTRRQDEMIDELEKTMAEVLRHQPFKVHPSPGSDSKPF